MKTITVYGIKNCDTMKKAFQWLDRHKVAYVFHDYKKSGADAAVLKRAIKDLGWENTLNRKGTTWRGLPDSVKEGMDPRGALKAGMENPSVIKRPLIVWGERVYAGFDEGEWEMMFEEV